MRYRYDNIVDATSGLNSRGFNTSFDIREGKMVDLATHKVYSPDDMKIIEHHRFEGMSNPSDNSVVFAIVCNDGKKGIVISTYGVYMNRQLINFLQDVKVAETGKSHSG